EGKCGKHKRLAKMKSRQHARATQVLESSRQRGPDERGQETRTQEQRRREQRTVGAVENDHGQRDLAEPIAQLVDREGAGDVPERSELEGAAHVPRPTPPAFGQSVQPKVPLERCIRRQMMEPGWSANIGSSPQR